MLSAIIHIDQQLFFLINGLGHPEYLNQLFLFFSFYPLLIWLLIGIVVFVVEEKREKAFLVRLLLALVLAGGLTSGLIKPVVGRPRPDITFGDQVMIVDEEPAS